MGLLINVHYLQYKMAQFKQIGNRYYKKEGQEIVKAAMNPYSKSLVECGRWTKNKFDKHDSVMDENTEKEYGKVKEHAKD